MEREMGNVENVQVFEQILIENMKGKNFNENLDDFEIVDEQEENNMNIKSATQLSKHEKNNV